MLHNIRLGTELAAPPADVYATYLDPRLHAEVTGSPVTIQAHPGAKFSAFGGALGGTILHLVPNRLIVQTWRSDMFKRGDLDSILILTLSPRGRNGTLLDLQQLNVPPQDFAGVTHGWELYYFAPWRNYLRRRKAEAKRAAKAGAAPITAPEAA